MATNEEILAAYDMLDDDDISTERLIQMVADHCEVEYIDVVDALAQRASSSIG